MSINDNDGFYIGNGGRSKNRYWLLQDPSTGDYTDLIPDSIHPNELLDDEEQQSVEVRNLATACLRVCDVAVVGIDPKNQRTLGVRFLYCKNTTPAVMRSAARLAVQSGWRKATLAVKQDLTEDCREAVYISGDVCKVKFDLLVVHEETP